MSSSGVTPDSMESCSGAGTCYMCNLSHWHPPADSAMLDFLCLSPAGTKRIKYLEENAAAFQIKLSKTEQDALESIFHPDQVI